MSFMKKNIFITNENPAEAGFFSFHGKGNCVSMKQKTLREDRTVVDWKMSLCDTHLVKTVRLPLSRGAPYIPGILSENDCPR